ALSACGLREPARRAYAWLRDAQRPDGSWPRSSVGGAIRDPAAESHHAAYVAVGSWHEYLVTGDEAHAAAMWPTVRRAIGWVLALRGGAQRAGRGSAAGLGARGGPARGPGGDGARSVRGPEPVRDGLVLPGAGRRGPRPGGR